MVACREGECTHVFAVEGRARTSPAHVNTAPADHAIQARPDCHKL